MFSDRPSTLQCELLLVESQEKIFSTQIFLPPAHLGKPGYSNWVISSCSQQDMTSSAQDARPIGKMFMLYTILSQNHTGME